jgi:hypothetical protein
MLTCESAWEGTAYVCNARKGASEDSLAGVEVGGL